MSIVAFVVTLGCGWVTFPLVVATVLCAILTDSPNYRKELMVLAVLSLIGLTVTILSAHWWLQIIGFSIAIIYVAVGIVVAIPLIFVMMRK